MLRNRWGNLSTSAVSKVPLAPKQNRVRSIAPQQRIDAKEETLGGQRHFALPHAFRTTIAYDRRKSSRPRRRRRRRWPESWPLDHIRPSVHGPSSPGGRRSCRRATASRTTINGGPFSVHILSSPASLS